MRAFWSGASCYHYRRAGCATYACAGGHFCTRRAEKGYWCCSHTHLQHGHTLHPACTTWPPHPPPPHPTHPHRPTQEGMPWSLWFATQAEDVVYSASVYHPHSHSLPAWDNSISPHAQRWGCRRIIPVGQLDQATGQGRHSAQNVGRAEPPSSPLNLLHARTPARSSTRFSSYSGQLWDGFRHLPYSTHYHTIPPYDARHTGLPKLVVQFRLDCMPVTRNN